MIYVVYSLYAYHFEDRLLSITGLTTTGEITACDTWRILRLVDVDKYILFKMNHGDIFEINERDINPIMSRLSDIECEKRENQVNFLEK